MWQAWNVADVRVAGSQGGTGRDRRGRRHGKSRAQVYVCAFQGNVFNVLTCLTRRRKKSKPDFAVHTFLPSFLPPHGVCPKQHPRCTPCVSCIIFCTLCLPRRQTPLDPLDGINIRPSIHTHSGHLVVSPPIIAHHVSRRPLINRNRSSPSRTPRLSRRFHRATITRTLLATADHTSFRRIRR
jgi:hypothetical protein